MSNPLKIGFRLQNIRIKNFSFSELEDYKLDMDKVHFEFASGIQINREKKIILILLDTTIFNDPNKEIQFCNITLFFEFHVRGLEKIAFRENMMTIPTGFLIHLFDISYSTTRGILFDKCAGTYLSKLILPVIDPISLIPKTHHESEKVQNTIFENSMINQP